jgi:hypothetical protein
MTTTRIVLSAKHKPYADELLTITGIDSLSNLFVILLTKYGSHLRASWDVLQPSVSASLSPVPTPHLSVQHPVTQSQNCDQAIMVIPEPEPEPEPELEPEPPDPVIERLSPLIDSF